MAERRLTNWLLAGILVVLSLHLVAQWALPVQAETLRLDACITEQLHQAPQQYLHVVSHAPRE